MSFLIIYISETEKFDADLVHAFLRATPGVHNIKQNADERTRLMAHYDFGSDSTIFDLGTDLKAIAISGTGIASLQICCMFQAAYTKPLRVIDEAYCFDLVILDFGNAKELGEAMLQAGKEGDGRRIARLMQESASRHKGSVLKIRAPFAGRMLHVCPLGFKV